VDASGAPVSNAKVTVAPLKNPQKMKDKKSDAQGEAEFPKLEDGAYRVFGRKEGFAPALYEFAMLKGSTESVTLKMAQGADAKLWFEDPAEEQRANALVAQGLDALKQNKFPDAEKPLNEALAIRPSLTEALYYLGVVNFQESKYDQGVQLLDKASESANAWMTSPSLPAATQTIYQHIIQNVQQLKKDLPVRKAEDALRQKNYEEAVKQLSELIKANPNAPELHANLATALFYSGRYDEALAAIDKAIQLKPGAFDNARKTILAQKENAQNEKAQAIMDEGVKQLQAGDAAEALKKFDQAKTMVSANNQWLVWTWIGKAQGKLNQPEVADSFKKAIELAPADKAKDCRNAVAQYYEGLKKYDDAIDVLVDPKAAGSESPEQALLTVAKNAKDTQPKLAEVALERVIKINPENIDAMFDLGQLYYSDGKENDRRTKELLAKYAEKGQDPAKLESAKGMIVIINRRTK
jgi:tetratricopeptide (TPR) repeat protein